jgi:hypothetical protein
MSNVWERRNIGDPYYYNVLRCKRVDPFAPGDCDECDGPCIIITDKDDALYTKVIKECCMFCGMEYMKWER